MRRRLVLLVALLAALASALPADALGGRGAPFAVLSTSVTQTGQDLTWRVVLGHPFSAVSLRRSHRSLCLDIEPRRAPGASLCVAPGRHGTALRLVRGDAVVTIAATISRPSPVALSAVFLPSAIGEGYTGFRWQVLSGAGTMTLASPQTAAHARLHTPRLVGCVPSGRDWVFSGPSDIHAVALTFDDGPWLLTPRFVALLAREHVPATFFQIGEWIAPYGEHGALEREMLADGDMIGDHTWTHPDMLTLAPAEQETELERTAAAIRSATGFTPCLWRAPYGDVDPALLSLARRLGFATMQWDVDPRDWALPGVGAIETTILDTARNGAIIEEHDGGGDRSETLAALPVVIARLRARGYRFETLTQLLGYTLVYR